MISNPSSVINRHWFEESAPNIVQRVNHKFSVALGTYLNLFYIQISAIRAICGFIFFAKRTQFPAGSKYTNSFPENHFCLLPAAFCLNNQTQFKPKRTQSRKI